MLDLPSSSPASVELQEAGQPLFAGNVAGADVQFDEAGRAWLYVDRPRLYALTRYPTAPGGS
jgi:hypothetical protein